MARKKKTETSGVAVIYARFSSHSQREASIEQQVKACMDYANRANLMVVETYADKAITGKTDRRPNFQKMMKEAEKGKFRYVIAWKSNRMGRNMLQAMVNEARLNELGIRCLYVEEDFDDTAAGRFALRNMMNVNQFYSENMAEDIVRGLMDNAEKCMINNPPPFGYKRGEDGRYAIDEPKAAIVREIFERVLAGDLISEIANDLNARGIKTARGNLWNKNSFHRMLANERYTGVYEYSGVRIEGGVPTIIRKELFYAVQEKLKQKATKGRHLDNGDFLLTGKLYCGHCGSFMVGTSGKSKNGTKHYYYSCQKRRTERACDKKAVRRDWLESAVAQAVKEHIMQDEVIEWIAAGYEKFMAQQRAESTLGIAMEELAEVKKSIGNLMTAIEAGIITQTTKARLLELEDQRKQLELTISIEQAAQADVSKERIIFWLQSFREGDVTSKKFQEKIIDIFVQAIYLYDGELRIVFNYCGKNGTCEVKYAEVASLGASDSVCLNSPQLHQKENAPARVRSLFGEEEDEGNRTIINATVQWTVARSRLDGIDTFSNRFPLSYVLIWRT